MPVRPVFAAAAAAALFAATPPARAADTMLLGGVGTSTARFADAPALTLKGSDADDATVENVHLVRRLAYGVTHPFGGYYRPYSYGFYRPYFHGYYRPYYAGYYRPYSYGFYRPYYYRPYYWGYYRPYGVGVSVYATSVY